MKAGEGLWSIHVQTSRPTRCLTGVARAEGGGEGAEAGLGEGLSSLLHLHHNHHPPRLLLNSEISEMIERPFGPSIISGRYLLKEQVLASVRGSAVALMLMDDEMQNIIKTWLSRGKLVKQVEELPVEYDHQ